MDGEQRNNVTQKITIKKRQLSTNIKEVKNII